MGSMEPPATITERGAVPEAEFAEASPVRVVLSYVLGWSFSFVVASVVVISSLVTFGVFWRTMTPWQLRFWGRWALRIQGVRVEYEGLEHIEGPGKRVVLFNHSSGLDAMLVPSVFPEAGVAVIKREVLFIPLVGLALYLMGFIMVARGRGGRSKKLLMRAAERMERDTITVFIAPEGTRTHDGSLQAFKRGAFHLALASRAPLVPMVVKGGYFLYPRHRRVGRPGTVKVKLLPPIPTDDLTIENMPEFVERVREIYLRELAAA